MSLSICVAQLNPVIGEFAGNRRALVEASRQAHARGASLLLTPELSLVGGFADDLLLRPDFLAACDEALQELARETAGLDGLAIAVGHPLAEGAGRVNGVSVIREGAVLATASRRRLRSDRVFAESRCFVPGQGVAVLVLSGMRVGLLLDEGDHLLEAAQQARQAGAEWLAVIGASPYHVGSGAEREERLASCARACGLPLVAVNAVGGHGELLFEGRSLAVAADGQLAGRATSFEEELFDVQVRRASGGLVLRASVAEAADTDVELWQALVTGLRDYVTKSGFDGVALGLSGGMDSALVLVLAVDALGADRVHAMMMPSPYTMDISLEDARELVRRLGVRYDEVSIAPAFEVFKSSLAPLFAGRPEDTTEENIQARIRGVMLMALSNKLGHLILACGNKSECAVGYSTLYGDMCGGFAPIRDVVKSTVYRLARWRNAHDPYGRGTNPIPQRIMTRPPSAELRPDQTDQDSLPPYEVLDAIIERHVEQDAGMDELVAEGFAAADVHKVLRLIRGSEYKRQQSAPGTRVTRRGFGRDWRYPIVNRFGP